MALVIDSDGKEVLGGIASIRAAFQAAGGGRIACTGATMVYDHSRVADSQVLTFTGFRVADGSMFQISETVPPGGALAPYARAMAAKLLGEQS